MTKDKQSIVLPKEFDPSKVKFSYSKTMPSGARLFFIEYNGSPLYLQSPEMALSWDASSYEDGPNSKYSVKTNMNLTQESTKVFHDKMLEFDERLKELAKENSVEWFKKKNMSNDAIEALFKPTIKAYQDSETGEFTGKFPPQFSFKMKKKDGNIECACFNGSLPKEKKANGKMGHPDINFNEPDKDGYIPFEKCLKKNTLVKGIFKCDFVWGPPSKFGCTWSAQQLRIKVPESFDEFAFREDSDDEDCAEKLAQGTTFVDTDSEEEEEIEKA